MCSHSAIDEYLRTRPAESVDAGCLGYLCALAAASSVAPEVSRAVVQELVDQRSHLKLIASENYCSLATQLAMGNLLTDKYAEGFPGHRFYEGCDNVDSIEAYACEQARKLFKCDHAYVQPHSGADANLIAYWAILHARVEMPALEKLSVKHPNQLSHSDWEELRTLLGNQRILGMDYYAGGHLTHGYRPNISARMFDAYSYGVSRKTGLIDYDELAAQAREVKPLILLAGYSAYPRAINFRRMREIADSVGAVFMVDMAHFAGLVAGGVFENEYNPVLWAQVVTSTTHKTLRGPRGGLVLCTREFAEHVDKGCPLVIGGPLPHIIAAKAVAFTEANQPSFRAYANTIVENAQALAAACVEQGLTVATGGTDNHLMLIDVTPLGLTGRQAAGALRECGVTLNFNSLPFDGHGPLITSGLRLGTPAVTTLGMGVSEMQEIAAIIKLVLSGTSAAPVQSGEDKLSKTKYMIEPHIRAEAQSRVKELLRQFPLYPELDIELLKRHFG